MRDLLSDRPSSRNKEGPRAAKREAPVNFLKSQISHKLIGQFHGDSFDLGILLEAVFAEFPPHA